jgi:hypothetical protein
MELSRKPTEKTINSNTETRIAEPTIHSIIKKDPLRVEIQDLLMRPKTS